MHILSTYIAYFQLTDTHRTYANIDDHFRDHRTYRPKNFSRSFKGQAFNMNDLCHGVR